jgi:hypothetical protein
MNGSHWRKSNQFFGLTRRHAEIVLNDQEAERSFREHCGGWYAHLNQWKECIADEHYVPTLLASLGLEDETYCRGWGLAYTDWSDNWIHPKSFKPRDVTPELLKKMRWNCENMTSAVEDSRHMFLPLEPLLAASSAQQACQALQAPMPPAGARSNGSDNGGSDSLLPLGSRRYAHPLDGACPLTGGEQGADMPVGLWHNTCGVKACLQVFRAANCLCSDSQRPALHCPSAIPDNVQGSSPPAHCPTLSCPAARKLPAFTAPPA